MGSRAEFLTGAAVVAGASMATAGVARAATLTASIDQLLDAIPGKTGAYIVASGSVLYQRNADFPFVVGSCFKAFVATVVHQMIERGEAALDQMIPIDKSVYVPGSTAFTPKLHGEVPVQVALQEMIAYSDNTATDMLMKLATPARIRQFIASAGLSSVKIPDSVRALYSYGGGLPEGQNATYEQLYQLEPLLPDRPSRPITNDVVTSKCSPRDLATYYRRALSGEFFAKPQTLADFRVTMSTGAGLAELAIPHGSSAYMKGGSIDGPPSAIAVGGAMCTLDKSVYFSIDTNWEDAGITFAQVENIFLPKHKAILERVRAATLG
jgi:beta-lactamase class A